MEQSDFADSWHSYPKVWNLGHPNIAMLFEEDVTVEEKIDGSQFSFGIFHGELKCRSRGQQLMVDSPEKMFQTAIDRVKEIADQLEDGWTYRAEYLMSPSHNTICYRRIPNNNLIIFDINTATEKYLPYDEKAETAEWLGFECVPLLFHGKIESPEELREMLQLDSILGEAKIEGVVCKNYTRFGRDGHALLGKFVSEAFKEQHGVKWKNKNPGGKDIVENIGDMFKTDARWEKAVQHLKERGELENSPKDIGGLLKELHIDFEDECEEDVKRLLYKWCLPKVKRIICRGFPEWYKQRLLDSQFQGEEMQ